MIPLVGVAVVLGSILVLRLHAFLALMLGALTVAVITPTEAIEAFPLRRDALKIVSSSSDGQSLRVLPKSEHGLYPGAEVVAMRFDLSLGWIEAGRFRVERIESVERKGKQRQEAVLLAIAGASWSAKDLIVASGSPAAAKKFADAHPAERVTAEFGRTCGSIGLLIALAAIVGKCLLDSGGADRIVRWALATFGEVQAPLAFAVTGFVLGIPVFFDTVFYLMIPLAKALQVRAGGNYLLVVMSIVCGATMTHSLVPPTPGPLIAAQGLGVSIGTMIVGGFIVGLFASAAGYLFAVWLSGVMPIEWREADPEKLKQLQELAARDERELPPLWLALAPILLPVLLITLQTALEAWAIGVPKDELPAWFGVVQPWAELIGQKDIAMFLGAAIAMGTVIAYRDTTWEEMGKSIQTELMDAGSVILITAAGGALGGMINQCGVSAVIGEFVASVNPIWILPVAFLVTSAIRTAQGSATVAMITAVSLFGQFSDAELLGFHPVYLALAIGCGSKPFTWMADSGFWVITRMSGLTEWETLRSVTLMMAVMGLVGLIATMVGAAIWPMV